MQGSYIIITPAFNEENNIRRTIESILKQTVLPLEWIIVNDGSTDSTSQIILNYSTRFSWIRLLEFSQSNVAFGEHVFENFYRGFGNIKGKDWKFIMKLDADLEIDRPDFIEYQLGMFKKFPELGISSGITYSIIGGQKVLTQGRPNWRTGGAMKFYRRECFEQIGGLKPIFGWDGLDEYQAMFYNWKTRTFFDLHVNHLGKIRALSREKTILLAKAKGKSLYQRGYPIEFVITKGISLMFRSKEHGKALFKGYFLARRTKEKQYVERKEKQFFRKFQYMRLYNILFNREGL